MFLQAQDKELLKVGADMLYWAGMEGGHSSWSGVCMYRYGYVHVQNGRCGYAAYSASIHVHGTVKARNHGGNE